MTGTAVAGSRRAVIITGAATGIGFAAARRFAADGDRVAILDRNAPAAAAAAAALGGDHFALAVDVADKAALVAAIGAAHARLERVDVLVNNAATIYQGGGPTLDLDTAAFHTLIGVNVLGAETAAREVAAIMRTQGTGGAIVNLASLAGIVAVPNRTAYSATKAAIYGLTQALADELAPFDIRVNAVLPGFTATETYLAAQRERGVDSSATERRIPLGRMAAPDEIAAAICHLASSDARFTIGTMLTVDGGFHVYGGVGDASPGGAVRPTPQAGPRVALIAGAATPVGAVVASRLTAHGTHVALLDDAINRPSADAAVQALVARFGMIDLLVNARESPAGAPFDTMLDEALTTALIGAQAVVPVMISQGGGAIVNLCPAPGPRGLEGTAGQSATRAAMAMLTRSLACEWAQHAIRVNAVVPGHAEGAAAAIDFLGSGQASYITGATYDMAAHLGR